MTTEQPNGRSVACRFCGRAPRPGQHRAPGPRGPICTDCLEAGLALVRDGKERLSLGGTGLARIMAGTDDACEFCGRRERRTFLGFHRSLPRMSSASADAVICADCLNRGGELINKVLGQRALKS